ncbi:alpha/beta hydrolase [Rossellomorea aquimaris]|uniref:alpha/beta hydrolase n=1 Tax=Rossellomorea aquimaris TaxID=189382 RepID=UPI001CD4D38A|nr:alpha/beta fold hydrolase [Rossellomorea aquimaris]MCA1055773.1 alpha/beta hydrolase [Rossellomorea aquimaris]
MDGKSNLEYVKTGVGDEVLVIETGIGNSFYEWIPFIEELKDDFTMILYHRAGYGRSRAPREGRTASAIAMELHTLIEELNIAEFILAGHSFGGLCAQQYARMFPEKLKGILLIDATSHHFQRIYDLDLPVMNSLISLEKMVDGNLHYSKKSKAELRMEFNKKIEDFKGLHRSVDNEFEAFITRPNFFSTVADEFRCWGESSREIMSGGDFPDIPLLVIARDQELSAKPFIEFGIPEEEAVLHERVWRELQIKLAELSSKGELIIAEGSDHEIHKDQPELLVECIKRFAGFCLKAESLTKEDQDGVQNRFLRY